jgi:hypothetical protein
MPAKAGIHGSGTIDSGPPVRSGRIDGLSELKTRDEQIVD